jgi:hypothetical protein
MKRRITSHILILGSLLVVTGTTHALDTVEGDLRKFSNQEQVKMMNAWLEENEKGTFRFTGLVDPSDGTVVTPQATIGRVE